MHFLPVRATASPLPPPCFYPLPVQVLEASPHRIKANHVISGLTNTLGGVRSPPILTPAAVPRSPFVPRTAQLPCNHVENSTKSWMAWALRPYELWLTSSHMGLVMLEVIH